MLRGAVKSTLCLYGVWIAGAVTAGSDRHAGGTESSRRWLHIVDRNTRPDKANWTGHGRIASVLRSLNTRSSVNGSELVSPMPDRTANGWAAQRELPSN